MQQLVNKYIEGNFKYVSSSSQEGDRVEVSMYKYLTTINPEPVVTLFSNYGLWATDGRDCPQTKTHKVFPESVSPSGPNASFGPIIQPNRPYSTTFHYQVPVYSGLEVYCDWSCVEKTYQGFQGRLDYWIQCDFKSPLLAIIPREIPLAVEPEYGILKDAEFMIQKTGEGEEKRYGPYLEYQITLTRLIFDEAMYTLLLSSQTESTMRTSFSFDTRTGFYKTTPETYSLNYEIKGKRIGDLGPRSLSIFSFRQMYPLPEGLFLLSELKTPDSLSPSGFKYINVTYSNCATKTSSPYELVLTEEPTTT